MTAGMNQTNAAWTPELKDQVKTLWADHSATEISAVLNGQGYTFSRNSIIGVLHRANMTGKDIQSRIKKTAAPRAVRQRPFTPRVAYELPETVELRCVEIVPRGLTVLDKGPGDCCWPYGDDAITFCGHPKMAGSSYCVPHFHLSRGPGTPSERAATRGIAA